MIEPLPSALGRRFAASFIASEVGATLYGGDYNPEQWDAAQGYDEESIWRDDMRLMRLAGVNAVSVGIFSWTSLQPSECVFTLDWLDRLMALLAENDVRACLATPTAAQPAWLSAAYPDVLPVDESGLRRQHGRRQNYCPTSPDFRRLAQGIVRRIADRYRQHPALLLWHVSNEYGPYCYCPRCAERFRAWLRDRYGSLSEVNRRWVGSFWSHTYTDWEQIAPPATRGEQSVQGLLLDYRRFMSEMNLECYRNETEVLRELTPNIPITTNLMSTFKPLDYFAWAPYLDIVSWDSYPRHNDHPAAIAFRHELMRGLKDGAPWLLIEQTPSQVQWTPHNPLKRPGEMRQLSYQAIAHGADGVMFFQWRQSRGAEEMFHGAVVSHAGHENTRVFRDVAALGAELRKLGATLLGSRIHARVALVFSWPNWWSVEFRPGPSSSVDYVEHVLAYYRTFWDQNIAVDIIAPDHDLSRYDLVVAPLLHAVTESQAEAIAGYVQAGGTFLTTFFSGIVDADNRAWLGGYPGPLRRTLGIWVEEFDPLEPEMSNRLVVPEGGAVPAGSYACDLWCDLLHLEGATALASYGEDFYSGRPAVTENRFGRGRAVYVGTRPEPAFMSSLIHAILSESGVSAALEVPAGVEVTCREGRQGSYLLVLNHADQPATIRLPGAFHDLLTDRLHDDGALELQPRGVAILTADSGGAATNGASGRENIS
jgi:beta-galactosidase